MSEASRLRESFAEVLARVRRARGFPTAHAFYRGRDGRRNFGLTFANYLKVEKGESMPRSWRFEAIFSALGLEPHSRASRELVSAYLAAALGSDRLLGLLGGFPPGGAPDAAELAAKAARLAVAKITAQLGLKQWELMSRDYAVHTLFFILGNTSGWTPLKRLTRLAGLSSAETRRAALTLQKAGLAVTDGKRARSAFVDRFVESPPVLPATAALQAGLRRNVDKWAARGRLVRGFTITSRMTEPSRREYLRHLEQAINLSAIYDDPEPAEGSSVLLVETRMKEIFA